MKLILNEKTYIAAPAKARLFRQALVITKENDLEDLTPDMLDQLVNFIVEVFRKEITIDDLYDNLDSEQLINTVAEAIEHVVGKADENDKKK